MNYPINACCFVELSVILRNHFTTSGEVSTFWELVADDAPFSWGNNDHSLVTASSLADHCQGRLDDAPGAAAFVETLLDLDDLYIDLES